jgi:hypothetical protein
MVDISKPCCTVSPDKGTSKRPEMSSSQLSRLEVKCNKNITTHPRSQTRDLTPPFPPQISTNNPRNPRPQHLLLIIQKHHRVIVKPHESPIRPHHRSSRPHHNSPPHISSLDFLRSSHRKRSRGDRSGLLDDADDLVAHSRETVTYFVLEDIDALDEKGSSIINTLDIFWFIKHVSLDGIRTLSVPFRPIMKEKERRRCTRKRRGQKADESS